MRQGETEGMTTRRSAIFAVPFLLMLSACSLMLSACSATATAPDSPQQSAPTANSTASASSVASAGLASAAPSMGSAGSADICSRLTRVQIKAIAGVDTDDGTPGVFGEASAQVGAESCVWKGPGGPVVMIVSFGKNGAGAEGADLNNVLENVQHGGTAVSVPGTSKGVAVSTGGGVILTARANDGSYLQVFAYKQSMDQAIALATRVLA